MRGAYLMPSAFEQRIVLSRINLLYDFLGSLAVDVDAHADAAA